MATISLDVDGTYTEDPVLWDQFIQAATRRGHHILVVTYRYPHEDCEAIRRLRAQGLTIIFTGRQAKQDAVKQLGYEIDVWIDDMIWTITENAKEYNHRNNIVHP